MSSKYKYVNEYEIRASPKTIYPYLHNPMNLSEWFADVHTDGDNKVLNFIWDNSDHYAKVVSSRLNKQIKFEFLDEKNGSTDDPNFLEFKLTESELTNSTFLKITDYSEMEDEDDLHELWDGMVQNLKELIGG